MMIEDFDDFDPDPIDSSYGFSEQPTSNNRRNRQNRRRGQDESPFGRRLDHNENIISHTESSYEYEFGFTKSSFLAAEITSEADSHATALLKRAKCSTVAIGRAVKCGPNIVDCYNLLDSGKLSEEDGAKLKRTLEKESLQHWDAKSLFVGSGVEPDGSVSEICLIRLCDLLTNVEQQLLVMNCELLSHGRRLDELNSEKKRKLGFKDENNCRILSQTFTSIRTNLANLISEVDVLEGVTLKNAAPSGSSKRWPYLCVAAASAALLLFSVYKTNFKLAGK